MTQSFLSIRCKDFDLDATLESGQVFGFEGGPREHRGFVGGCAVTLAARRGHLELAGPAGVPRPGAVRHYFDLDRDLGPVYRALEEDERLRACLKALKGLRLIRQEAWNALAGFILSSNNNVPRIRGIWRRLSARFGRTVEIPGHGICHGFPGPEAIARSHEKILRETGLGYRAGYLLAAARFLSANPGNLDAIRQRPYEEARERILAFPGIGPKVADCVLLYGFHRLEAFPVDVWILRVMRRLYYRNRSVSPAAVNALGRRKWGALAGYVQQYLFHGARTGVL